jgi:hypothetical protein
MQQQVVEKPFMPVKDYAVKNDTTVQAVYQKLKRGNLLVKKIGTYTLVADK